LEEAEVEVVVFLLTKFVYLAVVVAVLVSDLILLYQVFRQIHCIQ
jgi:hypothetical protein